MRLTTHRTAASVLLHGLHLSSAISYMSHCRSIVAFAYCSSRFLPHRLSRPFHSSPTSTSTTNKYNLNPRHSFMSTRHMSSSNENNNNESVTSSNPSSFASFLQQTRDIININSNQDNDTPKVFIMGNEAGDADSIVSALALSYIKHYQPQPVHLSFFV